MDISEISSTNAVAIVDPLDEAVAQLRAITRREARVDQTLKWLVEGATVLEISDTIAGAWPDAQPTDLLIAATTQLEEAGQQDVALVLGFCTQATLQLYKDMKAIGDYAGALAAIKTLARLHQLN